MNWVILHTDNTDYTDINGLFLLRRNKTKQLLDEGEIVIPTKEEQHSPLLPPVQF
jgi:hypothetical protein